MKGRLKYFFLHQSFRMKRPLALSSRKTIPSNITRTLFEYLTLLHELETISSTFCYSTICLSNRSNRCVLRCNHLFNKHVHLFLYFVNEGKIRSDYRQFQLFYFILKEIEENVAYGGFGPRCFIIQISHNKCIRPRETPNPCSDRNNDGWKRTTITLR